MKDMTSEFSKNFPGVIPPDHQSGRGRPSPAPNTQPPVLGPKPWSPSTFQPWLRHCYPWINPVRIQLRRAYYNAAYTDLWYGEKPTRFRPVQQRVRDVLCLLESGFGRCFSFSKLYRTRDETRGNTQSRRRLSSRAEREQKRRARLNITKHQDLLYVPYTVKQPGGDYYR